MTPNMDQQYLNDNDQSFDLNSEFKVKAQVNFKQNNNNVNIFGDDVDEGSISLKAGNYLKDVDISIDNMDDSFTNERKAIINK